MNYYHFSLSQMVDEHYVNMIERMKSVHTHLDFYNSRSNYFRCKKLATKIYNTIEH